MKADQLKEDPTKKAAEATTETTEGTPREIAAKPKGEEETSMTPEQSARIEELNQQLDLAIEAANELNAFLEARKAEHRIVNEDFAKEITPSLVELSNPATSLKRKWQLFDSIQHRTDFFRDQVVPPIKLAAEQRMRATDVNKKIPDISGEHAKENSAFASELEKIALKIKGLQNLKQEIDTQAGDIQALRNSPLGIPNEFSRGDYQTALEKDQDTANRDFMIATARETVAQIERDFEEYKRLGEELEKKQTATEGLKKKETGWLSSLSKGRKEETAAARRTAENEVGTLQFKRSELSKGVQKTADAARKKIDDYFARPETSRMPFGSFQKPDAKNAKETLTTHLTNLFQRNKELSDFAHPRTTR